MILGVPETWDNIGRGAPWSWCPICFAGTDFGLASNLIFIRVFEDAFNQGGHFAKYVLWNVEVAGILDLPLPSEKFVSSQLSMWWMVLLEIEQLKKWFLSCGLYS